MKVCAWALWLQASLRFYFDRIGIAGPRLPLMDDQSGCPRVPLKENVIMQETKRMADEANRMG
jgi:hypothetical protein